MGVAEQLGIAHEDDGLLRLAAAHWRDWAQADPRLKAVDRLEDLRRWLTHARAENADEVLQALARRGSVHGDDDPVAAATLAWALLPGACTLAHRLRTLSPRIDEVVAAQLWLEIRGFPAGPRTKIAANILMNTRAGVLRDCGAASQVQRADPTWHQSLPVDPHAPLWGGLRTVGHAEREPTPAEELLDLLAWACDNDVITDRDRGLLLSLVAAADRQGTTLAGRGRGGLMANDVTESVGRELGLSATTVKRRASACIDALSQACTDRGISA